MGRVSASLSIVGINVVFFLVQQLVPGFTELFILDSARVLFEPWRLVTSMFLHADPTHLLFNMYALFIFGPLIEQRVGRKGFLSSYFAAGLFAALVSSFVYSAALGASGAIMGIIGLTIMLLPQLRLLLFFIIPVSMRTAGVIFALIDVFGIFVPNGTANLAHLAGLGMGLLIGWRYKSFLKNRPLVVMSTPSKRSSHFNTFSPSRPQHTHPSRSATVMLNEDDMAYYLKHGRFR